MGSVSLCFEHSVVCTYVNCKRRALLAFVTHEIEARMARMFEYERCKEQTCCALCPVYRKTNVGGIFFFVLVVAFGDSQKTAFTASRFPG